MFRKDKKSLAAAIICSLSLSAGCAQMPCGDVCQTGCDPHGMGGDFYADGGGAGGGWGSSWTAWRHRWFGPRRSFAIPEQLPLGVVNRAHYQAMETNAEAVDFILYDHDFVLNTAELTSDGKDKVLEIAARMRSAPFPVLVERSENNSDPELDAYRRNLIAQILTDLGNPDGDQRTIVSMPYGPGYNSIEAERNWFLHLGAGQNNGLNNGIGAGVGGGIGGAFGGGVGF